MKQTSFTIRKRKDSNKYQAIIRQKQDNGAWKQVESKGGFDKKIEATQWANIKVAEWQKK